MKFLVLALTTMFLACPGFGQQYDNEDHQIVIDDGGAQVEAKNYYYDFGGVRVGHSATARFTLSNNGRFPIYIDSIRTNGQGFADSQNCPRLLFTGQRCRIYVRFSPFNKGQYSGELDINLTGSQDIIVHLRGRGVSRF